MKFRTQHTGHNVMGPLKKVLFQVHQFYENKFRELRILNKSLNICHLFISFQSLNILPEMYKSGLQTTLLAIVYTRSLWGWPPLPHGYVKAQALKTNHFISLAGICTLWGHWAYLLYYLNYSGQSWTPRHQLNAY